LYERHRVDRWPAGGAGHAARRTVCANDAVGMQFLAFAAALDIQAQAALVWSHAQETRIKTKRGPGLPGVPSKGGNKPRALDDQVRLL
jgi:hypothetical protein